MRNNFPPMGRSRLTLLAAIAFSSSCTKEKPLLHATFHASCRDCIVSYAVGPEQSRKDTLVGAIDTLTGMPAVVTMQWPVDLKDGDNLFIRGCQRDTVFHGVIQISVDGDVAPLSASAPTDSCAEINQPSHAR